MTKLIATECDCRYSTSLGEKKPEACEKHGNLYVRASSLSYGQHAREVSDRHDSRPANERRLQRRTKGLKRGRGFAVDKAQREKVRGELCVGCGEGEDEFRVIDPAHLWPRGKGGCDHPDCVIPLCRSWSGGGCHRLFDEGKLEILGSLITRGYWIEMAHPILCHEVSPSVLLDRLTYSPPVQEERVA